MNAIPALILAAFILPASADPVKVPSLKVGDRNFTNATVTLEGRLFAKIQHESGMARVRVTELPEDVQAKLLPPQTPITAATIKDIPMRNIPVEDRRFQKILKKIQDAEESGWIKLTVTVLQSVDGMLLATLGESSDIVMVAGDTEARADGDLFTPFLEDTGKLREYTTVLGAKRNVRVYTIRHRISAAELVKQLQSGETYLVYDGVEKVPCKKCEGRPVPCQECDSTGVVSVGALIRVKW